MTLAPVLVALLAAVPGEPAVKERGGTASPGDGTTANAREQPASRRETDRGGSNAPRAGAIAARLRAEHRVILVPSPGTPGGAWTVDELRALEAGLRTLPASLRRYPGPPLELERHALPRPFGMGDGSSASPDWSSGRTRFHLYEVADRSTEPRAEYRLEGLDARERRTLWRRRAIVHAVLQRWDDALALSDSKRWRNTNGWRKPFEGQLGWTVRALSTYEGAYSRRRGMASPSLDLVTFAEELFVPAESIRSGAVGLDDQVRCQEFTKSRALYAVLDAAGLWDGARPERVHCPAFERWARLQELEQLELWLVSASGRRPESLFGHLMLRPTWREGERVDSPALGTVVQLVALTGSEPQDLAYVWRGLTGGYSLVTLTVPEGDVRRELLIGEQRSIRRFRLNLTPDERQWAMERIWELERRTYAPYYFFTDNCATAAVRLLNDVLERGEVSLPSALTPLLPAGALDRIAAVKVARDGKRVPLLEPLHDTLHASEEQARYAARERRRTAARLARHSPPALRGEWSALLASLESAELDTRIRGHHRLFALARGLLSLSPQDATVARDVYRLVDQTVRLERVAADRAEADALKHRLEALRADEGTRTSLPRELARRQASFLREEALQRRQIVIDRIAALQRLLDAGPPPSTTPGDRAMASAATRAALAFSRLTAAQGTLIDEHFASVDPQAWLSERAEAVRAAERRVADLGPRRSGVSRVRVSAAAFQRRGQRSYGWVLQTAAYLEQLGDHRAHGLRPSTGLGVLAEELAVGWDGSGLLPKIEWSNFTLLSIRTLLTSPPLERRSLLDLVGWELRAGWDYRSDARLAHRAGVRGGILVPVLPSEGFVHFGALGVGAITELRYGTNEARIVGGPRVGWTQRHQLGRANVALDAYFQALPGFEQGERLAHELGGALALDWWFGAPEGPSLVVGPTLRFELASDRRPSLTAELRVELL